MSIVQMLSFTFVITMMTLTSSFQLHQKATFARSTVTLHSSSSSISQRLSSQYRLAEVVPSSRCLSRLHASTESAEEGGGFDLSAWLNINTRGGVIVWSGILILVPIAAYQIFISQGYEETTVGAYVGALFVLLSCVGWGSTYIFRVATKDMTYAKQLRDYENAVLQKRLDELADDEIDALMKEIESEDSAASK